ncbi:MAG: hypothetical protein ABIU18_09330 [Novosphingobium sp.]
MVASPVLAKDKKEAAAPAAAKANYSKPFVTAAGPFQKALEAARKRPDVVAAEANVTAATNALNAATTSAARKAAGVQRDAAIAALRATLTSEKGLLDATLAAATVPDDKFMAGNFQLQLGGLMQDTGLQRTGLQMMIDSGKANPADVPKFNFYVGQFALDAKDYAAAQTALQASINGGYTGNDVVATLAEVYIAEGQAAAGLDQLQKAIDAKIASGALAPENWYRRGLGVAYKNKLLDKAAAFSTGLVKAYPSTENWAGAISVLRLVAKYDLQDRLDLMRLMARTHSFTEATDYAEFIQAADPRRLPAEVLTVLDEGVKSGKLSSGDVFVSESRAAATVRIKEDQPTLPGLEKSALAPNATGVSIAATADALLSYGMPAKAEGLYNAALAKGGVDVQRIVTRIGIAQFDQGKFAEAKANFDKVTGVRQPLAQLWSIYAGQKAKGV